MATGLFDAQTPMKSPCRCAGAHRLWCASACACICARMRAAKSASGKNSFSPMQLTRRKRCQTRTRPRKKACVYGALVSGATIFSYVGGNPLSRVDPTGLKATSPNMSPAPDTDTKLCFDDGCARERQACTALCTRARFDSDMPNVFGGSFRACMRGCVPARCGGN